MRTKAQSVDDRTPIDLIAFKWAETLSEGEQSTLLASSIKRLSKMIVERCADLPRAAADSELLHWRFKAGAEETMCGLSVHSGVGAALLPEAATCPMCKAAWVGYTFGRADAATPRAETGLSVEAALKDALEDANGLCRSAMAIAKRRGIQTNWTAFEDQLKDSLERQHKAMYGEREVKGGEL